MSRPVIPPLPPPSTLQPQSQQTSEVLRRRLASAEEDARQILSQLGVNTGQPGKQTHLNSASPLYHSDHVSKTAVREKAERSESRVLADKPPLPTELPVVEPSPGSLSQDALISRVCKLESMLQTLKLGVAGASTGGLSVGGGSVSGGGGGGGVSGVDKKRLRAEIEERVAAVKQELGTEVVRLRRQMASLQEELAMETEARWRLKEESDKLKEVLEEATQARAEATAATEEMSSTKQRLMDRINDLKEEVARETSLRASLESSHTTLMARVHETEVMVERERNEAQSASASTKSFQQEAAQLKEELSSELSRRQMAEEACQHLIAEKGEHEGYPVCTQEVEEETFKYLQGLEQQDRGGVFREWKKCLRKCKAAEKNQAAFQTAQADCQKASSELSRLQNQYSDLIRQFEQTQKIVDRQRAHVQELEVERDQLHDVVDREKMEHLRSEKLQKQLHEAEESHRLVREDLTEEMSMLRKAVSDLTNQNASLMSKIQHLNSELEVAKNLLANRERDFSAATSGLEMELSNMRRHLQGLETEKESVLKGKENLLEEVNQTVDSLMSERSRLQEELETLRGEAEALRVKWRQTEAENAQLMERLGSFEHQQRTQHKVETTLQDMVEQKNRLAYDNGRLQSQVAQLTQDLATAHANSSDSTHLRKVNEAAQTQLIQLQRELSDFKMMAQKLEGRLTHTSDLVEQKQHELQLTQARRQELEREMGKVLGRVEVLESREKSKTKQHQKNMDDAKSVNREIASTLEAVMQSHTQLQELVESLQGELGRKDTEIGRLKNLRVKEQDNFKLDRQRMEETIVTLQQELAKEQDKSGRKTNRDIAELKKQSSNLSTRNGELVATNSELRQRAAEMERTIGDLQHKLSAQKHRADHMHRAKKHMEQNLLKMKKMGEDIDELERLRDEYMLKNKEQADTIATFMQQMTSLQEEVQQLAAAHLNTGRLLQMKEDALEKERNIREDLKKKFTETKKKEDEVSKQKHLTDEKLKEAHNESVEISRNLMDAHEWFKGKFEKLQDELTESRTAQAKLEQVAEFQQQQLFKEKSHAQEAAERAKEMIKASRLTISKLADYTEQADCDTKQQLADLRAEVQREKARASCIEDKYHRLKDAGVKVASASSRRSSHR